MGFMTELRYKRDDLNEKLKDAPWWAWAAIVGVLVLLVAVPVTCSLRDSTPRVTVEQRRMEDVRAHLTVAFSAIVGRLAELPPNQRPDLQAITSSIAAEKGADFFTCPVTGEPYRINPDPRAWMMNVATRLPAGVSTDEVLMVAKSTPAQEKAGVMHIGLRVRRIPVNMAAGEEPAWMDEALVPGG